MYALYHSPERVDSIADWVVEQWSGQGHVVHDLVHHLVRVLRGGEQSEDW